MFCGCSSHVSSTKEDRISPLWNDQVCMPPFSYFSACTMIENATIVNYTTILQNDATLFPYDTGVSSL
jgi:hypothetical protein